MTKVISGATRDGSSPSLRQVKVPARQAVVFVCGRCEHRLRADDHPARRLTRRIKKLSKETYGKGAVRSVTTSCMSLCPRNAIAVAVVPADSQKPRFYLADAAHPKAAAKTLVDLIAQPAYRV